MAATVYGCEIVWPSPIGSGLSAYASFRNGGGTNSWRGTAAIASRTRGEETPRLRICVSIIARRSAADGSKGIFVLPMRHYKALRKFGSIGLPGIVLGLGCDLQERTASSGYAS